MDADNCPLCGRVMIAGKSVDNHHLIPKTFKGRDTITIHRICHTKIHSIFSERDLFNYYHTIERLLEDPEIQKFIKWVSKKDPEFYDSHKDHAVRRAKRKK